MEHQKSITLITYLWFDVHFREARKLQQEQGFFLARFHWVERNLTLGVAFLASGPLLLSCLNLTTTKYE